MKKKKRKKIIGHADTSSCQDFPEREILESIFTEARIMQAATRKVLKREANLNLKHARRKF